VKEIEWITVWSKFLKWTWKILVMEPKTKVPPKKVRTVGYKLESQDIWLLSSYDIKTHLRQDELVHVTKAGRGMLSKDVQGKYIPKHLRINPN